MCLETRPNWWLHSSVGKTDFCPLRSTDKIEYPLPQHTPVPWLLSSLSGIGWEQNRLEPSPPGTRAFLPSPANYLLSFFLRLALALPRPTRIKFSLPHCHDPHQKMHRIRNPPYVNQRSQWIDTSEITSPHQTECQPVGTLSCIKNTFPTTVTF